MPALVVKMKGNIKEKCLPHYKVLYKSLSTFFFELSTLDFTLVHFIQILSEYCISIFLLRITCLLSL